MCNGLYGLKPSNGRIPYGGQQGGQLDAIGRIGLQAVAGPIANCIDDIDVVMAAIESKRPWEKLGCEDVLPWTWTPPSSPPQERRQKAFVVGILSRDGLVEPLPPITNIMREAASALRQTQGISVVQIPTPPAWRECQVVANSLMAPDGGGHMFDLLESTQEPLVPWLKTRLRRGKARDFAGLRELHAKRMQLETEMNRIWTMADGKRIDAIICPIAPHPVPPIDRWNAVNYTSSFVLLDWPAGTVPIRDFCESDMQLNWEGGNEPKIMGSWDKVNRELWTEKGLGDEGRKVYLGTALSVQVLAPRGQDRACWEAMRVVDDAVRGQRKERAKL